MKSTTREDLKLFPVYEYCNREIKRMIPPVSWNNYLVELHHFVKRQVYNRNPEKYKDIQKLIFLPVDMHRDADNYHSRFKEKWGVELREVIYMEG